MKIIPLGETDSLLGHYLAQLRDKSVQKDSLRFRKNLERIGEIFAYEISKTLAYQEVEVETPLGIATSRVLAEEPVLATILRAGLPVHQGLLNCFDHAQNAFVAAYRKYGKGNECELLIEYQSCPPLEGKTLIISDAMIASGASMEMTYESLTSCGEPAHTHIVCPVASRDGVEYLSRQLPHKRVTFWVGAIDEELTNHSYIVPGLGDAGNLAFGEKD
ncbi:MAG: uracil phosphoribosyltransferase [Bacteroidales bacterium]|jgi:uracil phosphoribosyltransferase|nr:uracil phosphoribosyltransferase [Bacteroidales bacterium]MBQ1637431.1 uracil phosphoribosyltransferase [Bacteroidales bacterium]MBQ1679947.1 uracil phosphoribosyltransferase [Bacteroidales bacterium]MBQ1831378.1 uracil phosphoribosyltransferase [Bacteroidales bacterium]MBQ2148689.1 uracil phosphoribosyltransferase [Bacteroidales bacterium]